MPAIPPVPPLPPPGNSSLAGSDFNQTYRINQVFQQLLTMLGTLQGVAIAQAENLNFLTSWQQAYTDLMSQVPVFTASSSIFGGTSTMATNTRNDVNQVNSTYLEQLRTRNSILGDSAKAMNASLSQTNDAVTQFGNMATSFLQQLSTLLPSILISR